MQYNLFPSLGLPGRTLLRPAWSVLVEVNMPIFKLNVYRKFQMKEVSQKRLVIAELDTDDPFLIRDMLELRVQQITIDQRTDDHSHLAIDVRNTIGQEMLVCTDHIRTRDGLPASICDKVPLFKLGVAKYAKLTLKPNTLHTSQSDVYRQVMISFPTRDSTSTLQHNEIQQHMYVLFYGAVTDAREFVQQTNDAFKTFIDKQVETTNVAYNKRFNCFQIVFVELPEYLVDAFCCYTHDAILQFAKQIKINLEPKS